MISDFRCAIFSSNHSGQVCKQKQNISVCTARFLFTLVPPNYSCVEKLRNQEHGSRNLCGPLPLLALDPHFRVSQRTRQLQFEETLEPHCGLRTYPGKPIYIPFPGNEIYYTNASITLRTNCVVIFVARKRKKNKLPWIRTFQQKCTGLDAIDVKAALVTLPPGNRKAT